MIVPTITAHALVQWLDRVELIGMDGVRMKHGETIADGSLLRLLQCEYHIDLHAAQQRLVDAMPPSMPRDGSVEANGLRFILTEGRLITVYPPTDPRRRKPRGRKSSRSTNYRKVMSRMAPDKKWQEAAE